MLLLARCIMRDERHVPAQLSWLYQLVMAFKPSGEVGENCADFLKALLAHPDLTDACIWWKDGPSRLMTLGRVDPTGVAPTLATTDEAWVQTRAGEVRVWPTAAGAQWVLFPLGADGLLQVHTAGAPEPELIEALRPVSERLAAAIRSGLTESRAELALGTLDATAEGVLAVSEEGRVLLTNQRFAELWRIPADLLASRDDRRLLGFVLDQLVDPQGFIAGVERLYACDETSSDLLRFKDGRVFHRSSKALLQHGRARVWSFSDVTAQHAATAELQAERNVFMDGPIGVLIWRAQAPWLEYASANIDTILGYSAHQLLGAASDAFGFTNCIHPDDLPRVTDELAACMTDPTRRSWQQNYRVVWPDGSVHWLADFKVVERDAAGYAIRLRGYITDETATHETARRLALTSERLQFALQGANDGLWDWDLETNHVYYSPRWLEMLGFAVDELPATLETWSTLAHPDDRERTLDAVRAYVEGRTARYEVEFRMRHKRGDYLHILSRARLASPTRLVGTHVDLTTQRATEDALREAKRSAEAASRAKSRFLATMSHEIRTPLNGVLGMAQLLLVTDLPTAERQEYARTILNSGQTLLALLNDLLDLSKIEAGKLDLTATTFELGQLLDEVTALMAENAASKGLTLLRHWRWPPGSCFRGDAIRVRQMLGNLLSNAIKFTERGQVAVEVQEVARVGSSARIRFLVRDTGIGILADEMERLFKPFSQLDGSDTRRQGGTGLGLSIVSTLAERMGGQVGASSEAGKGSCFWFELPLEVSSAASWTTDAPVSTAPGMLLMPARVLVAEDNRINRLVVQRMLEKMGFAVVCAEDGREALALFRREGKLFDVILMDQQMPVMDGLEAARAIRADESGGRVPIIALTANTYDSDRDACAEAGMDDFLSKPVNAHELLATLKKWLARRLRAA